MAYHIDFGKKGEESACAYLLRHGFTILERNWRAGHAEIDIIAVRNGCLHFIEVKTRTGTSRKLLLNSLGREKLDAVQKAAIVYMERQVLASEISFDLIIVVFHAFGEAEIEHIPAFFYPQW